jgi:hypothetical protein
MGMAEVAVALWTRHLRHNPANPSWPDRDRFVLSKGHGSMLLYALLHLSGYGLAMEHRASPSAATGCAPRARAILEGEEPDADRPPVSPDGTAPRAR